MKKDILVAKEKQTLEFPTAMTLREIWKTCCYTMQEDDKSCYTMQENDKCLHGPSEISFSSFSQNSTVQFLMSFHAVHLNTFRINNSFIIYSANGSTLPCKKHTSCIIRHLSIQFAHIGDMYTCLICGIPLAIPQTTSFLLDCLVGNPLAGALSGIGIFIGIFRFTSILAPSECSLRGSH